MLRNAPIGGDGPTLVHAGPSNVDPISEAVSSKGASNTTGAGHHLGAGPSSRREHGGSAVGLDLTFAADVRATFDHLLVVLGHLVDVDVRGGTFGRTCLVVGGRPIGHGVAKGLGSRILVGHAPVFPTTRALRPVSDPIRCRCLTPARVGYRTSVTDRYTLPPLPYGYDALEPWLDAETLHLHHDKHHQAYVTGANAAAEALDEIDPGDANALAGARAALAFNLSGHVLHSLFWENLSPDTSAPSGALAAQIDNDFGSVDALAAQFAAICKGVQGSGWGALIHDPVAGSLYVAGIHDHQSQQVPDSTILALVDVWEHAYYLKYRNDRAAWVKAAWEHLDWTAIGGRFDRVPQLLTAGR